MAYRNRAHNYGYYQPPRFDNARMLLEDALEKYADQTALRFRRNPSDPEAESMTFREFEAYVRDLSTQLHCEGCEGQYAALIAEASPEWFFTYYACMSSGLVLVPIDRDMPAQDIAGILNKVGCTLMFFSPSVANKCAGLLADVPSVTTPIVMGELPEDVEIPGCRTIDSIREEGAKAFADGNRIFYDYEINNEGLASIVFTSGTTGKGKGVMLSHRNICSDMEQGMYNFNITKKTLFVLPPHHTFGSTIVVLGHLGQGCEIYITSGIRYVLKEMQEFKPTSMVLVPLFVETFYKRIISAAEKQGKLKMLMRLITVSNNMRKVGIDMRKQLFRSVTKNFGGELEMIICGGAALQQSIIDFFDAIGITILNGYGITECAPLVSCNRNCYRKDGSVGLPIVGGELKVIDPDENGEGEIAYRGPNVMMGYFQDEEATKEVIDEEGWFRTGDYGRVEVIEGDQWLYITGRLKNLIIFSNGKNVYPEEIEFAIHGVDGVNEVVVYAGESRSNRALELIVAEIYPDAERLEALGVTDPQKYFEDAVQKINAESAPYKKVGLVRLRDTEFPKNTSKKITRFAIDKAID